MDYHITMFGQDASVKLSGQFTFIDTQKFKTLLELTTKDKTKTINLDFSDITFIDSASMGMLLLLRDECQSQDISLNIHSPQGQVERIFHISKFDQLFSITRD